MEINLDKLPKDPELLQELILGLVEKLKGQDDLIAKLKHQLSLLQRGRFGKSSERFDEEQGRLDFFADKEIPTPPKRKKRPKKKQAGHGRRKPQNEVPETVIAVPVPEDRMICKHCNVRLTAMGLEVTRQIDYIPPKLNYLCFEREVCSCPKCHGTVEVADIPHQPIKKGMPGPGLLAHIITSKYMDHIPLQRLKRIFRRSNFKINASTMCGWIAAVVSLLKPIHDAMLASILTSMVISTDATGIQVKNGNKKGQRKSFFWAYLGDDDNPHVMFDFTETHSRAGPKNFLKNYSGYLQADAHPVYDNLFTEASEGKKLIEVGCMAHCRRRFFNSQNTDRERAEDALKFISALYDIEECARDVSHEERKSIRESLAEPIIESFHEWLKINQTRVLPKSPIGEAINYASKHWGALTRYLEDGRLKIDNNHTERALRGVVIGRKNYMFAGSEGGARNAAFLYSFVESCKRNDIDPYEYLRDILIRIDTHPASNIDQLLPANWKALVEETGLAKLPYEDYLQ